MTCGSGADPQPPSDDVLEDQFTCMADYLRQRHRHRVDIYVQVPLTGECMAVLYFTAVLFSVYLYRR